MPQAVALGLATTMVGAFSDDEVKRLWRPAVISVGTPLESLWGSG
jgi:hypothetical protein